MGYEWYYPISTPNYYIDEKIALKDFNKEEDLEIKKLHYAWRAQTDGISNLLKYTAFHNEYYIDVKRLKNDCDNLINLAYEMNKFKKEFEVNND